MVIGVDFDNTIASYDELFHRVAVERCLIPPDLPQVKNAVRDYLRDAGQEACWTEMQGEVYGGRMAETMEFPGVKQFFALCRTTGVPVYIISHKTRYPFLGTKYDLHAAATSWLEQQGFLSAGEGIIPRENVFFELTKVDKLRRIARCCCTHFVDDLPEFLGEMLFPPDVERVLFDPSDRYLGSEFRRARSWAEVSESIFRNGND